MSDSDTSSRADRTVWYHKCTSRFLIVLVLLQSVIVLLLLFSGYKICKIDGTANCSEIVNTTMSTQNMELTTTKPDSSYSELNRPVRFSVHAKNGTKNWRGSRPINNIEKTGNSCTTCPQVVSACPITIIFVIDICACGDMDDVRILRSIHLLLTTVRDVYRDEWRLNPFMNAMMNDTKIAVTSFSDRISDDVPFTYLSGLKNLDYFRKMVYQMVQNSIEIHAGQGSDVVKALAHATQKLEEERYTVQNVIDFCYHAP